MKRQERRGAESDGDLSNASRTEEERPESAQQPVAPRQVRRALATTAQDDQLLLEQEILRDHRSHTAGATELRGHDGEVQQGEQEIPHAPVSVGQMSGAAPRNACPILNSARELAIRDPQAAQPEVTIAPPCLEIARPTNLVSQIAFSAPCETLSPSRSRELLLLAIPR